MTKGSLTAIPGNKQITLQLPRLYHEESQETSKVLFTLLRPGRDNHMTLNADKCKVMNINFRRTDMRSSLSSLMGRNSLLLALPRY